jgi:hypothetical protein
MIADEELARMEDLVMDAARRRLQAETCCRIEKIKAAIELRDFVVIQACAEVEEPFHVAEVVQLLHITSITILHGTGFSTVATASQNAILNLIFKLFCLSYRFKKTTQTIKNF